MALTGDDAPHPGTSPRTDRENAMTKALIADRVALDAGRVRPDTWTGLPQVRAGKAR
ncbi:hypothetical protein [Streptomyces sp. NPDC056670]|uniref:hypothetical protein n=1 Tax=Streptomyces sp. NPDC056670 TaxID=3345904 RepID=UPI0036B0AD74